MKTKKSSSALQPGVILYPGGHLETCGDTVCFQTWAGKGLLLGSSDLRQEYCSAAYST